MIAIRHQYCRDLNREPTYLIWALIGVRAGEGGIKSEGSGPETAAAIDADKPPPPAAKTVDADESGGGSWRGVGAGPSAGDTRADSAAEGRNTRVCVVGVGGFEIDPAPPPAAAPTAPAVVAASVGCERDRPNAGAGSVKNGADGPPLAAVTTGVALDAARERFPFVTAAAVGGAFELGVRGVGITGTTTIAVFGVAGGKCSGGGKCRTVIGLTVNT